MELLQNLAKQGKADMLDVEVCELEQPKPFSCGASSNWMLWS